MTEGVMLKLIKLHNSPNWSVRGTFLGISVYKSTGTSDQQQAEILRDKIQQIIFEQHARDFDAESFVAVTLRYMKNGGDRQYVEPLLHYFGDTSIDQIDQTAIRRAATSLYPRTSAELRNRQVYAPMAAILKYGGITTLVRPASAGKQGQSVYVIRSFVGSIKVGVSTDPYARLAHIQVGSSAALVLDYAAAVTGHGDLQAGYTLEGRARSLMENNRLNGEWFDTTTEHAIDVLQAASRSLGYELRRWL